LELLFATIFTFVFGVIFLKTQLPKLFLAYRIWRSEPMPANQVRFAEKLVEVEGRVEDMDGNTVTTEYTGTDAVAHDWVKKTRNRGTGQDRKVESKGEEAVPFRVVDDTGKVVVDPEGADLSLDQNDVSASKQEGALEPGDYVHIYGQRCEVTEECDDIGHANFYICDGDGASTLRITDGTETVSVVRLLGFGLLGLILGTLFMALTVLGIGNLLGVIDTID